MLPRKRHCGDGIIEALSRGEVLCEPRKPLGFAYFPLTGFISPVTSIGDHVPMEMGLIGNEGVLGATLMLGVDDAPFRAVVQGKGSALKINASQLRRRLLESPTLRKTRAALGPAFLFIEFPNQLEQPGLGGIEITAQFRDLAILSTRVTPG